MLTLILGQPLTASFHSVCQMQRASRSREQHVQSGPYVLVLQTSPISQPSAFIIILYSHLPFMVPLALSAWDSRLKAAYVLYCIQCCQMRPIAILSASQVYPGTQYREVRYLRTAGSFPVCNGPIASQTVGRDTSVQV